MKAGELLTKQKDIVLPLIVNEDEEIDDVLQKLLKHRAHQIIYVRDGDGKLTGYIHSSKIIKHYASEHVMVSKSDTSASDILHMVTSIYVRDIMKKHILVCNEDDDLKDIFINMMKEKHPYIIAVLNNDGEHIGFLDLLDMTEEIVIENGIHET